MIPQPGVKPKYFVAVFLYWMALYLHMPTLPTYVESKGDTPSLVGVLPAQYGLWQAIARLPVGAAADWVGRRKPFVVVGFGLTGLGALAAGLAVTYWLTANRQQPISTY